MMRKCQQWRLKDNSGGVTLLRIFSKRFPRWWKNSWSSCTTFIPLFSFYTSWKQKTRSFNQKIFDIFRRYRNRTMAWNGLKRSYNDLIGKPLTAFFYGRAACGNLYAPGEFSQELQKISPRKNLLRGPVTKHRDFTKDVFLRILRIFRTIFPLKTLRSYLWVGFVYSVKLEKYNTLS